ncbi:TPA: acyltransferase [Vibrio parahaemolyticus]|uniref:acyltransferase n=1 Tax=Vibrio parahaemolyticus TaxID=670 RepID=UPI003AAC89F8|nr:acyltransferase [Vibrio parahaemolyticus]
MQKFIIKFLLEFFRPVLIAIDFVNPRLFMRVYFFLLKKNGLKFKGKPRYISPRSKFDLSSQIILGERIVISHNVILLTHDYSITTALRSQGYQMSSDLAIRKSINIGSNVFIGMNAILLPGTHIGNNVIIGAGSVVTGSIPDNSVVAGNPACTIRRMNEHYEKCHDIAKNRKDVFYDKVDKNE